MKEQNKNNKSTSKRKLIIGIVVGFVIVYTAYNVITYMLATDSLTP